MICYWSIDFDFRGGNVQANADTEPLSDVDEQPQERHVPWPQTFIIPRESVRSHVLAKLDKRPSLTESERTSLFSTTFDICIKYTYKIHFCFYEFSSKEKIIERKILKSIYTI